MFAELYSRGPVNEKRRTLQEVCELATKEYDASRLSDLVEEVLELLTEAQDAKARDAAKDPN
jgi:hypothetical protein